MYVTVAVFQPHFSVVIVLTEVQGAVTVAVFQFHFSSVVVLCFQSADHPPHTAKNQWSFPFNASCVAIIEQDKTYTVTVMYLGTHLVTV